MTDVTKKTFFNVRYELWICLLLVVATAAIYFQVAKFEFINFDTDQYVYENHHVKEGLTANSIRWAFSTLHVSNWHPLTWLSHMLDVELYGLNPGRHHLTSVFFHIVNTLLLFGLLTRMTGNLWRCGFVAALFALHPLHVESVVWIAERKDIISTLFGLLAIWSYTIYGRNPRISSYSLIVLFFILSLMAKPMMVTLPFVLLLLDYWPLRRLKLDARKETSGSTQPVTSQASAVSLIVEKIPLFILSAASCLVTVYAQKSGGAVVSLGLHPLQNRIANALVAYAAYIGKMFWPGNLAIFYPHPGVLPVGQVIISGLLLAIITYFAVRFFKPHPWFLVSWFWYLGTLVPVIGLVQVGVQAMADRYTYVPLIGLFIIIVWGFGELMTHWKLQKMALTACGMAIVGLLTAVTWQQIGYWRNSTALFKHAFEVTDNNSVAHNNYALGVGMQGKTDEAIKHFKIALKISPNSANARINLGLAFYEQGKLEESRRHFERVLQIKPNDATAHNYLGKIQNRLGAPERAIPRFRQAIKFNPQYAEAYNYLGVSLYRTGKADQAIPNYLKAIRINPSYAEAYNNAGAALIRLGEINKALALFREAVRIAPDYIEAQKNLSKTLAAMKSLNERSVANQN